MYGYYQYQQQPQVTPEETKVPDRNNCEVGDIITAKIWEGNIVPHSNNMWDEVVELKIIGVKITPYESTEFLTYLPDHDARKISGCEKVDGWHVRNCMVEDRFIGSQSLFIQSHHVFNVVRKEDGMCCCNCDEFYEMAEPNQEDGTLVCYLCRFNPWR